MKPCIRTVLRELQEVNNYTRTDGKSLSYEPWQYLRSVPRNVLFVVNGRLLDKIWIIKIVTPCIRGEFWTKTLLLANGDILGCHPRHRVQHYTVTVYVFSEQFKLLSRGGWEMTSEMLPEAVLGNHPRRNDVTFTLAAVIDVIKYTDVLSTTKHGCSITRACL